jgi:hypothetical protein
MTIYAIEIDNNQDETLVKDFLSRLDIKFKKIQNGMKFNEMDATDYLFSTQTNKTRLLKALENADKGENLTEINLADFKKQLGVH